MIRAELPASALNRSQRSLWQSTERNICVAGGFGSGKTTGGALKAVQLKQANGPCPGLIVAPNWRTMWSVTYRAVHDLLRKFLHRHEMPRLVDKTGECYLDFGDGSPIFLRSASNTDGFDGVDVGWAWCDEGRYYSAKSWQVIKGRVRRRCTQPQTVVTTTPAMNWLHDEFNSGRPGRRLITAPTHENSRNLADGFIDDIKQSYSPRVWRALIEGEFTILEGAVFEAFDPNPTTSGWFVPEPTPTWLAGRRIYLAVDPGYRRSAWLWIADGDNDDEWIVFDEMIADNMNDGACVREVNRRGHAIDEIWVDIAGGSTQSFEGASTITALRDIKRRGSGAIRCISGANREIAYGVDKLRVLLGGEDQPRRIKFSRKLIELERGRERGIIRDLAALRYPEAKHGRPVNDVPLKDGVTDHFSDCIRYWAVGRWLCSPKLRRLDPSLNKSTTAGFRTLA